MLKILAITLLKNYISDIRNFYKWYKEISFSENLQKVTSYHLNAYKDHLIHSQRKKVSSINRNIQSLKNFFQFLIKQKYLKNNPSEKLKFLRRTKRTKPRALSKSDIHKLLSVTAHSSHGTKNVIMPSYSCYYRQVLELVNWLI